MAEEWMVAADTEREIALANPWTEFIKRPRELREEERRRQEEEVKRRIELKKRELEREQERIKQEKSLFKEIHGIDYDVYQKREKELQQMNEEFRNPKPEKEPFNPFKRKPKPYNVESQYSG